MMIIKIYYQLCFIEGKIPRNLKTTIDGNKMFYNDKKKSKMK